MADKQRTVGAIGSVAPPVAPTEPRARRIRAQNAACQQRARAWAATWLAWLVHEVVHDPRRKYETVRAEPLGDGRERRYIAAWFPPGDDQKGRPLSAHTFRELTAEQLATCRTESYVVRLLGGLDDDARRKARASNSVQMSEAARRLYRPLEAAAKTSQHHRRTRERRAKLRDDDPEAARLAREADAHRKREKRANLNPEAARLAREADAERKRKERQK